MTPDPIHLPEVFCTRLEEMLGKVNADQVLASLRRPSRSALRINQIKSDPQVTLRQLKELGVTYDTVDWHPYTFSLRNVEDKTLISHSTLFQRGDIYLQDLSSILAAKCLGVKPGEQVLDLAAAPGGKTLLMADAMANTGRIAAIEPVKSRFFRLKDNVDRYGATCIELFMKDGRKIGRQCPDMFDRTLLDAPCSSEARFSPSDPASFQFWSEKKIKEVQRKQKQLLYSAIQATRCGGYILYSTCSFAPEENEAVIDRQLKIWKNSLSVEPLDMPVDNFISGLPGWRKQEFDPQLKNAARILPGPNMHGFFICLLRKG